VARDGGPADHPSAWMEISEPRRSAAGARERPADRRAFRQARLDRPALAARGKSAAELREGGPRADGGNEIVGLVLDDPAEGREVEPDVVTRRRIANAEARRAAADHDRLASLVRTADRVDDLAL